MSKGGPNSGILIPFGSPLVNHYKDVLICCIIVNCMIRKFICYTVLLSDSGSKNKCYVMLYAANLIKSKYAFIGYLYKIINELVLADTYARLIYNRYVLSY